MTTAELHLLVPAEAGLRRLTHWLNVHLDQIHPCHPLLDSSLPGDGPAEFEDPDSLVEVGCIGVIHVGRARRVSSVSLGSSNGYVEAWGDHALETWATPAVPRDPHHFEGQNLCDTPDGRLENPRGGPAADHGARSSGLTSDHRSRLGGDRRNGSNPALDQDDLAQRPRC